MLYSVDTQRYVKTLPHQKDFDVWRKRLTETEYQDVCDEITKHFDESEVNTSSWIPGHDWSGTPYGPLFRACNNNKESSGLFFGQIVFKLLMERPDAVWGFGRYEKDGMPIKGITYFLIPNPPPFK